MKSFSFLLAILFVSVLFVACEGDVGPEGSKGVTGDAGAVGVTGPKGDKGSQGDAGTPGKNGNVEVIILNDAGRSIPAGIGTNAAWVIGYDVIAKARAESSGIYMYLKLPRNPEEWVAVPGSVFFSGGSHQSFAMATRFDANNMRVTVTRTEGAGELAFSAAKFLIIPKAANGRQVAVDYSDYNAVKKYYNLAD